MRWTRSLPPDDLVLFVDGTDVLYAGCGAPPPPTAPTDGLQPPQDGRSDDAAARVRGAYRALSERLTRVMGAANASLVVGAELGAFDTLVVGAQASRTGDGDDVARSGARRSQPTTKEGRRVTAATRDLTDP